MLTLPDYRAYVRDIDFDEIARLVVDTHADTIIAVAASNASEAAAHEDAWKRKFSDRWRPLSLDSKMIANMAIMGIARATDLTWGDWSDARQLESAEAMVDTVTRLYLYTRIRAELGSRGDHFADALKQMLEEARFCRVGS